MVVIVFSVYDGFDDFWWSFMVNDGYWRLYGCGWFL